jgi:beta-1,4-mannosyl-glycoprotein beta-1,4-N-acetylglucosaminyltransferase
MFYANNYTKVMAKARSLFSGLRCRAVEFILPILPSPKSKIYDCFLFNNELDLLRLRLIELYSCVDCFVICECAVTFSGEKKPLHYLQNQDLFAAFEDKIKHFVIPEPPAYAYIENPINPNKKTSQFWQRNQMASAIKAAREKDVILISDVDEIPRASVLPRVAKLCRFAKTIVFFSQSWFLLFLDVRVDKREQVVFASNGRSTNLNNAKWLGTFACSTRLLRQHYRGGVNRIWSMKWGNHHLENSIVEDAGWHFSYMGGINGLLTKIQANGMTPYSNKHVQDLQQGRFADCVLRIETIGKNHPEELLEHPESWSHLLIQQDSLTELASRLETFLAQQESMKE